MRRLRKLLFIALASAAGLFLAVVAAWAVDGTRHDGRVARNVDLAGRPVGGLTKAELAQAVAAIEGRYRTASVHVVAPKGSFVTDAATLGVHLDPQQTVDNTMAVGRSGGPLHQLGSWLRGVLVHRRAPVQVRIDDLSVRRVVPKEDPGPQTAPVEPTIKLEGDKLVAVDGKPGKGIDPAEVVEKLPAAARKGTPITVRVHRGAVQPRFQAAEAERLVDTAVSVTKAPLPVKAGSKQATVPAKMLRSWITAEARDDGLALAVDQAKSAKDLAALLPDAGQAPAQTRFNVVGGVPQIIPGAAGTGCCGPGAARLIEQALPKSRATPVTLPLTRVEPTLTVEQAKALGVKEQVSTFTTPHKCCEPRVTNIHRIADLIRGYVIKPGETFSVNTVIGKRTTEKGFVVAPVIQDGEHAEDVGGGISQFATTTFNAAFFAGLDFGEYQSHSLVIGRYPYGREATMGFPHPDLQIKNTTPYGVLIWPTYTGTSFTVTFYSTHFVDATQTGQTSAARGPCTRVSTERTRKYLDGTTKVDRVFALYRPAEGVDCPR
ncbi:MAG TPA: VanW family protein [Acidimicrobiales bacterium]|nr:VanW family protein [Acidimicrobiales bacterium]